jgi:putative transposase
MTTTKTNIALAELAEKGADADPLKQMIQYVAQRMMEMDAESLCAAAYGSEAPSGSTAATAIRTALNRLGR